MNIDVQAQWMLRALIALAKVKLKEANENREEENDWPAGQEWHQLGSSSQHIFMRQARKQARIPDDEYSKLIENMSRRDHAETLDKIWAEMEETDA